MKKTPEEIFEMNRYELEQYVNKGGSINLEIFAIITLGMIFNSENGPRDFQASQLRDLAAKIPEFDEILKEINTTKKTDPIFNTR